MVGWHHQLSGHEFEQTLGDSEGQGSLKCCTPWGLKESDKAEQLNNNTSFPIGNHIFVFCVNGSISFFVNKFISINIIFWYHLYVESKQISFVYPLGLGIQVEFGPCTHGADVLYWTMSANWRCSWTLTQGSPRYAWSNKRAVNEDTSSPAAWCL